MEKGNILQYATPDEIYSKPANQFVASFIGRSALVAGRISKADREDCLVVVPELANATLVCAPIKDAVSGAACNVVIRTSEIRLSSDRLEQKDNVLEGTIVGREYRGGLTDHRIQVGSKEIVVTSHRLCPMINLEDGREKIFLHIDKSVMTVIPLPSQDSLQNLTS
jgi:ABC-type Fe3+/spermidine/putrescine transport system ATPase subunit